MVLWPMAYQTNLNRLKIILLVFSSTGKKQIILHPYVSFTYYLFMLAWIIQDRHTVLPLSSWRCPSIPVSATDSLLCQSLWYTCFGLLFMICIRQRNLSDIPSLSQVPLFGILCPFPFDEPNIWSLQIWPRNPCLRNILHNAAHSSILYLHPCT